MRTAFKQRRHYPPSSKKGPQENLRNARILARYELYARSDPDHQLPYISLHGPTFPLNCELKEVGAHWDEEMQSWLFESEASYQNFVDSLDQTDESNHFGLAEETTEFVGAATNKTALRRFIDIGGNSLENQDLLELLLSFDSHITNPASLSSQLIAEFGSLGAILGAEPSCLARSDDVTPRACSLLKAIQLTLERVMHEPIKEKTILGSSDALLNFLAARLQHRKIEELVVIYLDRRNQIIKTDSHSGTVDHVPLYPRQIASRALELFAMAVIIAHNHPSGNVTPSKQDIIMTKKVQNALEALDIDLYDHVIVCHGKHLSFKAEGFL